MTALHRNPTQAPLAGAPPDGRAWVVPPEAETAWLGELVPEPVGVRVSLARGDERSALQLALRQGVTDANRLTEVVFQGRHPERGGRPLGRDDKTLVREWLSIRDQVVRPALAAGPVAPAAPPAPPPGVFAPVPVESPGGGRLTDKHDPAPGDVVSVRGVNGKVPLHRLAADAWAAMISAARAEGIRDPLLLPVSGYRSGSHQERLWQHALRRYGSPEEARKWVAPPGSSAHQSGRAIDFYLGARNDSSNVAKLRATPAYRWLLANAQRFGFYPYDREPWHWEYNPPATVRELEYEVAHGAAPAVAAAPVDWCRMRRQIVAAALAEEPRWRHPNGTPRDESEPGQLLILRDYWSTVPGFSLPADALAQAQGSAADRRDFEWSAAFICFVMHTAGVRRAHGFEFSQRHMNYVVGALRNRERSDHNRPFWLVDATELLHEATPQPGDLLCFNRVVNGARTRHSYVSLRRDFWEGGRDTAAVTGSSHCAVIVATGRDARGRFLQTIGGNENAPGLHGSVLRRRIALTAEGQIANPAALHIFGMIKLVNC